MKKWYHYPLAFLGSAPVVVAVGMTVLILGGIGGGVLLTQQEQPHPGLMQSGLKLETSSEIATKSTTALLDEIEDLKQETSDLLAEDQGYSLMNVDANGIDPAQLQPRLDPFAPIRAIQTAVLPAESKSSIEEAKVTVPGEGSQPQKVAGKSVPPSTKVSSNPDDAESEKLVIVSDFNPARRTNTF